MPREIKFRVCGALTKQILGYEALRTTSLDGTHYEWCQSIDGINWTGGVMDGKGVELVREQCTGLKDKNDRAIFDRDVVRVWWEVDFSDSDEPLDTFEVKWWPTGGYWTPDSYGGDYCPALGNEDLVVEVIGDAYSHALATTIAGAAKELL